MIMGNVRFSILLCKRNASENEIELSAIHDVSEDFLSEEEINYYLKLKDL